MNQSPEIQNVPSEEMAAWEGWLRELFDFDYLHIHQALFSIASKYNIYDANGRLRFHVVRPAYRLASLAIGISSGIFSLALFAFVIISIFNGGNILLWAAFLVLSNFTLSFSVRMLLPYRHITYFSDESQSMPLLTVTQDNKIGFFRRYTLWDPMGNEVARFERDWLKSLFRRTWVVTTPEDDILLFAREDSLARSLLRRYLGPLMGALRTNFNVELPTGEIVGFYDRKLTLRDQYSMDLGGDPHKLVDRRVALALSVLLDTAEYR